MKFAICSCSFSKNIYIHKFDIHVSYSSRQHFRENFADVQNMLKNKNVPEWNTIQPEEFIPLIEDEIDYRKAQYKKSITNRQIIKEKYIKKHTHVYSLQESFLDSRFINLITHCKNYSKIDEFIKKSCDLIYLGKHIYNVPIFTQQYCQNLLEELENFEKSDLPRCRPNTMNRFGILSSELGLDDHLINSLRCDFLQPLLLHLFPDCIGNGLDSHKAFTVEYSIEGDQELGFHYDNAEITANICLSNNFEGGELYFGDLLNSKSVEYQKCSHKQGWALLHRGQQLHGAMPITSGRRCNLIIWMRSSSIRSKFCPMCRSLPNLIPVKYGFGDGFLIGSDIDICSL